MCVVRIIAIFFLALLFVRNAVFGLFPNRENWKKVKKRENRVPVSFTAHHLSSTFYNAFAFLPLFRCAVSYLQLTLPVFNESLSCTNSNPRLRKNTHRFNNANRQKSDSLC